MSQETSLKTNSAIQEKEKTEENHHQCFTVIVNLEANCLVVFLLHDSNAKL
jgi:hypothetical protein